MVCEGQRKGLVVVGAHSQEAELGGKRILRDGGRRGSLLKGRGARRVRGRNGKVPDDGTGGERQSPMGRVAGGGVVSVDGGRGSEERVTRRMDEADGCSVPLG